MFLIFRKSKHVSNLYVYPLKCARQYLKKRAKMTPLAMDMNDEFLWNPLSICARCYCGEHIANQNQIFIKLFRLLCLCMFNEPSVELWTLKAVKAKTELNINICHQFLIFFSYWKYNKILWFNIWIIYLLLHTICDCCLCINLF